MNQYTLDYSDHQPDERPPNRRSKQSFRQAVRLFGALICGIAFVAAIRMRSDASFHRTQYQTQAIRYDSLLAAKAEADRQLQQLRNLLAQTSSKP
ncbi:MAG: hypothetical protein H7319_11065 [Spirosoma sp.]|nr:hypothetical protein [Spirosoma sp.]